MYSFPDSWSASFHLEPSFSSGPSSETVAAQLKNKQMFLLLHSMLFNPTAGNSLLHSRATVNCGRYFSRDL